MQDGRVARTDDVLVIQNGELRLKLSNSVDRLVYTREHKARTDVIVLDTTHADAHVVPRERNLHLLFHLVIHSRYLDLVLVRHEHQGVSLADMARLELSNSDRAHILV